MGMNKIFFIKLSDMTMNKKIINLKNMNIDQKFVLPLHNINRGSDQAKSAPLPNQTFRLIDNPSHNPPLCQLNCCPSTQIE
jgi:protein involved in ribonucleotide reduction